MSTDTENTTWSGVGGSVINVRLSRTQGEVMCSIFQIPTTEVELVGGDAVWGLYDAAQLCCGHTFNVCALALHFLSNSMTCPVCRAGPREKMCLQTVPDNVKQLFTTIQPQEDVVNGISLNFDRNDIAAEVRLHVVRVNTPRLGLTGRPVRLMTPLRVSVGTGRASHMQVYSTHRTFQRYFNTMVESSGSDAALLVAIHHPLLDVPLRSPLVSLRSLTTNTHMEVEDDIAIAYTENVDGLTRLIVEVHTDHLLDVIVHSVLQSIIEGQ